ncbi:uncharacterized protein [Aegilops tauschii subsp. strangulata]|nr:uncharacterized protein LOC109784270 [Aegilops tauschii subsp. strangulata]
MEMEVNTDDMESLSDDSDWSSLDNSDIEELLQDDDVEMMGLLLDVQELEDRAKLKDQRRGSKMRRVTIYRNRGLGHEQLMQDYFAEIVTDCEAASDYFKRRRSIAGIMGFSGYQKILAAMQVIAYGIPADYTDEYLRIGQDTTMASVCRFAKLVIRLYGDEYLRAPNEEDTKRLMEMNEKRGWPGMLGSLDCMHWTWKNCPKAWQGMYCGKSRDATIVLEAVALEDTWIWHAFFGLPGTLNDINVLNRSPLFARLVSRDAPTCNYKIMDNEYSMGYYLTDGIYPEWATLVKSIKEKNGVPLTRK